MCRTKRRQGLPGSGRGDAGWRSGRRSAGPRGPHPDRWSAGIRFGTTATEQQSGEPLDRTLAEEEPEVTLDADDEAGRSRVGGGRTGTLSVSAGVPGNSRCPRSAFSRLRAAGRLELSGWLTVVKLPSSALTAGSGGSSDDARVLGALLGSATPVHGAWGSGRLLRTSLVSVLMTDQGSTFVGAVRPSVLYAAAARR